MQLSTLLSVKSLCYLLISASLFGCGSESGGTTASGPDNDTDITDPPEPQPDPVPPVDSLPTIPTPPEPPVSPEPVSKLTALSSLEVTNLGYPKVVSFRNESVLLSNVEAAKSYISNLNGVIIKTFPWGQSEEYLAPSYEILDDFLAVKHPAKLSMVQTIPQMMEFGDYVVPYLPYAQSYIYNDQYKEQITQAFDTETTALTLNNNIDKFDPDAIKADERAAVLIKEVGGVLQWNDAEFVSVLSIDVASNTVNIRRNSPGIERENQSSDGATDVIYLMSSGSKERGYLPNFTKLGNDLSAHSKTVQQQIAEIFSNAFLPEGKMKYRHGMAMDVGWEKPKALDVGSGQFPAAENMLADNYSNDLDYTLGLYDYLYQQRALFGQDVLLTSDSNQGAQRAVTLLNGMESEGFSGHDDVDILNWSVPFNTLGYFKRARYQLHDSNYVVLKDGKRRNDVPLKNRRLMFAGATALNTIVTAGLGYTASDYQDKLCSKNNDDGSCKTYKSVTFDADIANAIESKAGITFDEAYGDSNSLNWLGQPRGGLIRLGFKETDLFEGLSLEDIYNSYFVNKVNTTSAYTDGEIELSADKSPAIDFYAKNSQLLPDETSNRLKFNIKLPDATKSLSGDLLVRIQIEADGRFGYDEKLGDIPRNLVCYPKDSAVDEEKTASELYAYAGALKGNDAVFYWRDAFVDTATAAPTLVCTIDGLTNARIGAISAYNSNDMVMREYENGLIIVNPSLQQVSITSDDLSGYFPGRTFARLTGKHAAGDNLQVNNGVAVDNSSAVVLKERDGIFLKTTQTMTDDGDADGIPDSWELLFSGTDGLGGADSDADGDGYSDLLEMHWMSNPVVAQDIPAFASFTQSEDDQYYLLSWEAKLGRMYRIQYGSDKKPLGSYYEGFGEQITARVAKSGFAQKPDFYLAVDESLGDVNGLFWQRLDHAYLVSSADLSAKTEVATDSSWTSTPQKDAIIYQLDKQVRLRKVTVELAATGSAQYELHTSTDGVNWQVQNDLALVNSLSAEIWLHDVSAKYVMLVDKLSVGASVDGVRFDGYFN